MTLHKRGVEETLTLGIGGVPVLTEYIIGEGYIWVVQGGEGLGDGIGEFNQTSAESALPPVEGRNAAPETPKPEYCRFPDNIKEGRCDTGCLGQVKGDGTVSGDSEACNYRPVKADVPLIPGAHCEKHKKYYHYCGECRKTRPPGERYKIDLGENKTAADREVRRLRKRLAKLEIIDTRLKPGEVEYKKGMKALELVKNRIGEVGWKEEYIRGGRGRNPIKRMRLVVFVRNRNGQNSHYSRVVADSIEENLEKGLPLKFALDAVGVDRAEYESWLGREKEGVKIFGGIGQRMSNALKRGRTRLVSLKLEKAMAEKPDSSSVDFMLELHGVGAAEVEEEQTTLKVVRVGGRTDIDKLEKGTGGGKVGGGQTGTGNEPLTRAEPPAPTTHVSEPIDAPVKSDAENEEGSREA